MAAIADGYDALTSNRVYRKAFTFIDSINMIREGRSTHFDPELLDLFLDSMDDVLTAQEAHSDLGICWGRWMSRIVRPKTCRLTWAFGGSEEIRTPDLIRASGAEPSYGDLYPCTLVTTCAGQAGFSVHVSSQLLPPIPMGDVGCLLGTRARVRPRISLPVRRYEELAG